MEPLPYTVDNVIQVLDTDVKEALVDAMKLSKCFDPMKVTVDDLMRHGKKQELAECVETMAAVLAMCRDMMKGARGTRGFRRHETPAHLVPEADNRAAK